jgi:hypothetical protein
MSFAWPKIAITADSGEEKSGIAPTIISASRSTDIPAFYAPWFMRRLAAGYVRWMNPWSGKPVYVSFANARLIVFWSKNPAPLVPYLAELDKRGIGYYFQCTLNDYEREGFEKGVPPLRERIETLQRLSDAIGRERVLWRFDPLLATATLTPELLIERIERIGRRVAGFVERLTISFLTSYVKVEWNARRAGVRFRSLSEAECFALGKEIARLCRGWNLPVVSCAETRDLSGAGIARGKCIDDAYIGRVFGSDQKLMDFLGRGAGLPKRKNLKDSGQRSLCGCIAAKDIGGYDTCRHGCIYCYATSSARGDIKSRAIAEPAEDALEV